MTCNLKDFEEMYGFRPSMTFERGKRAFYHGQLTMTIENCEVYALIKRITAQILPENPTEHDSVWKGLYMPFRRNGKIIMVPFSIRSYKDRFFIFPYNFKILEIVPGISGGCEDLVIILSDLLELLKIIRKEGNAIAKRCVPYDIRKGRILGQYVLNDIMSKEEKEERWNSYKDRTPTRSFSEGLSLNDYLKVASICYDAAMGEKNKGLNSLQKYERWADGRHDGMLDIEDPDSREAFAKWMRSGSKGGHPFEIIFSWHQHGIHLYPPRGPRCGFELRYTNKFYMKDAVEMTSGLIKHGIPFNFDELPQALEYLSGEAFIEVNEDGFFGFHYTPSREMRDKYFRVIEWEPLDDPVFM